MDVAHNPQNPLPAWAATRLANRPLAELPTISRSPSKTFTVAYSWGLCFPQEEVHSKDSAMPKGAEETGKATLVSSGSQKNAAIVVIR